jgi:hypothetical protein
VCSKIDAPSYNSALHIIVTGGQNFHLALFQTSLLAIPTKHKQNLLIILLINAVSLIPLNSPAINFICMINLPKNFTQALPDARKSSSPQTIT